MGFGLFSINELKAQNNVGMIDTVVVSGLDSIPLDTLIFDLQQDITAQLIPLDSIIAIAIENSPFLKLEEQNILQKKYTYQYERLLWLNGITGFYNYSGGDAGFLLGGTQSTTPQNNLTNGTRYGINLIFPLTDLVGRPKKLKALDAEFQAAKHRREIEEMNVKKEIISMYYNMVGLQRRMRLKIDEAGTLMGALQTAEVEFEAGRITAYDLARQKNFYIDAASAVESLRAEFYVLFFQFEVYVGVKMPLLKRR